MEVSNLVQHRTDRIGGEVTADELWKIFADEYLPHTHAADLKPWGRFALRGITATTADEGKETVITVTLSELDKNGNHSDHTIASRGNGPIDAFTKALQELDLDVRVLDYAEHALSEGGDATAASYVECDVNGQVLWGVGIDPSTMTSGFKAIISAVNRALR